MPDLVSILIPVYNAQEWIKDTLDSALSQSWQRKEIIIVDDGSTDVTPEILRQYQTGSVKVVRQHNKGSGGARNKAIQLAQGDLIQWLDHDDLLHPNKIKAQIQETGIGGESTTLSSSAFGTFYFQPHRARFLKTAVWRNISPIDYLLARFRYSLWIQTAAWLVSRRLTEIAGPWIEVRTPDDDGEYFCRVVAASSEIRFVPEAKSYWRVGNPSSLSRRDAEALEGLFLSRVRCIDHLRALEDSERTKTACVHYLQNNAQHFYPERPDLFEKAQRLAQELGGELSPPKLKRRYMPVQFLFGYRKAKSLAQFLSWIRGRLVREWERLIYRGQSRQVLVQED